MGHCVLPRPPSPRRAYQALPLHPAIRFYKEATLSSVVTTHHAFYHSVFSIYNPKLLGFQEAQLYNVPFSEAGFPSSNPFLSALRAPHSGPLAGLPAVSLMSLIF